MNKVTTNRLIIVSVFILLMMATISIELHFWTSNDTKTKQKVKSLNTVTNIENTETWLSLDSLRPYDSTDKILVSIVVPTYNSEKYIKNTLNNLLNQTLRQIEIIVVDSSNNNNTVDIAKEVMLKDPRIRIFFGVKNVGAGPSRNKGIEEARGEYIGFVDSDDHINSEFYQILYRAATENKNNLFDIAKGLLLIEKDGKIIPHGEPLITKSITASDYRKISEYFTYEHTTGLFSMKLLRDHPDARYGTTFVGEDIVFLNAVGYYAKNLVFNDQAKYFYVNHTNSISTGTSTRKITDIPKFYRQMFEFLKKTGDRRILRYRAMKWKKEINDFLWSHENYKSSFKKYLRDTYEELTDLRNELRQV